MQRYRHISSHQDYTFGKAEKWILWHFESVDNQYMFVYQNHSDSTGKEKDVETGYGYFGARYMDHELMTMWLSVDPMADKYPSISPYAYCAWNPVKLLDPDGRDIWILIGPRKEEKVKWTANGLFNEDGSRYSGDNTFVLQTALALNAIYEDNKMVLSKFMDNSEYDISISETAGATQFFECTAGSEKSGFILCRVQSINFNPNMGLAQCKPDADDEEYMAPFICLLHEFGHVYNAVTDYKSYRNRLRTNTGDAYDNSEEMYVIQTYEHPVAEKHGMLQRTSHKINHDGLFKIITEGPLSSKQLNK